MAWWHPDQLEKRKPNLLKRMDIIKTIRMFFEEGGFTEVQTPILQVCPTVDTHIHAFETILREHDLSHVKNLYLHTSPEFDMKKLLAAGMDKIFQITPVFRNAENTSLHSPEFTMMEWYRSKECYRSIFRDCINLIRYISDKNRINKYTYGNFVSNPYLPWDIISVSEAFDIYAKIDLEAVLEDTEGFLRCIRSQGIRADEGDRWNDLFFRVMAEKIEPNLGIEVPCILYDYPTSLAALARKKPEDSRYAERFEVYICGVELANGFGELTDAVEQRHRINKDMDLKESLYGQRYPTDEEFLRALEYGLPECSGIAFGIDRLVMLATGAEHINEVLWAPVNMLVDKEKN